MISQAVAVIVPWRESDEHRAAAWCHIEALWTTHHPDWEVIEGEPPPGPWVKGLAVADGLARTDADILILADADVWCDGIDAAVDAVAAGGFQWAIPHWHVHRLTPEATAEVLAGGPFGGPVVRKPYRGFAGGGITVITRELYERAPIDPRFVGWGQEDASAARAWRTLGGKAWRGGADMWHLWHPPQPRWSIEYGSQESLALLRRYRSATGSEARMNALIAQIGADPGRRRRPRPRKDPMGQMNTWRNRHDGRIKQISAGSQRDKIFRRHRDWELLPTLPVVEAERPVEESTPADTEDSEPAASPEVDELALARGVADMLDGEVEIRHTGAGWYDVVLDGEVADRIRGKDAAETRATELLKVD